MAKLGDGVARRIGHQRQADRGGYARYAMPWMALVGALWLAACGGPRPSGTPSQASTQTVTVVSVHDGDTVRVRDARGQEQTVRLATIDAPELDQPYGPQAREALRERALGRAATLEPRGRDRYGRTLAVLWLPTDPQPQDLALWLVEQGWAWHYTAHAREQPLTERWRYALAEALARSSRKGLWAQPDPQPPWTWRRAQRSRTPVLGHRRPDSLPASAPTGD
ncbi:MAG: thermonuclease family protein [Tepidimonas sp.]|uniref:thermonuclease family protein n=1 Tax=Tepidimonas sp. TaxID=2002775 RepID=UPI00259DE926|nr:thermonuclease family protein [Tepidimonas sp.]MDM7456452.1 thermonuclease family protein [Tepidimonas sp.]